MYNNTVEWKSFNFKKKLQFLIPNKKLNIKKNNPNIENCNYTCNFFFSQPTFKNIFGFLENSFNVRFG